MSDDNGMVMRSGLVKNISRSQKDIERLGSIETPHNEMYKTFWFGYCLTTETMTRVVDNLQPYNVRWRQVTPNDGDAFYWYAPMEQGTYKIAVNGVQQNSNGIADFHVNGVEISSFDWYAAVQTADVEWLFNWTPTQTRLHEFKIVVDGKNASSGNYILRLTSIVIYRI
jgi:hypothetical protein